MGQGPTLDRRALLAAGAAAAGAALSAPAHAITPVNADWIMGVRTAPVTVIEYASASCSHCAQWWLTVFPQFKARFIDTGQVRYVLREFLTERPADADYEHVAAALNLRRNTLAVAVHRLRHRLRELVRAEIGETAAGREALNEELRGLRTALGSAMQE